MTPPEQRPSRRVWVSAVGLVALAVAVPVGVVLVHDPPAPPGHEHVATAVAAPSAEPDEPEDPEASAPASSRGSVPKPVRALLFGDSYFIGGGYTTERNSMAKVASRRLGWSSEVNGGGGTGFVQTNYEYDLGNYLDQIAQGAFDVGSRRWVVIEGGNNDLAQPLGAVRRNARKVVRIAQRTFPRARVVLVGPLDTDSDHTELVPMIRTMRKVAKRQGVPFVNMKDWLAGHYDLIGPDYVHPYAEGHRILGRKLAWALRGLGA